MSKIVAFLSRLDQGLQVPLNLIKSMAFFDLLEYLGRLTIIFGIVFFFCEADERQKQKHYQAWQVIATVHGQKISGGRIDALQDLSNDKVPLVGLNVKDANLVKIKLQGANLKESNFANAILTEANLSKANLSNANFQEAFLRRTNLTKSDLRRVNFFGAELRGTNLSESFLFFSDLRESRLDGANLQKANLVAAKLQKADLLSTNFRDADIENANFTGAINLNPAQIKLAKNWKKAIYDSEFRIKLGLPQN